MNVMEEKKILCEGEPLLRAFAKVGIIALLDEATGYQDHKDRAKDELQKILKLSLAEESTLSTEEENN